MAKIFKRPGSPFWYARFSVKGRDLWVSTRETNKQKAAKAAALKEAEHRGIRNTDDCFQELCSGIDNLPTEEQDRKRKEYANRLLLRQSSIISIKDAWDVWMSSPLKGNPSPVTVAGYLAIWKRLECWCEQKKIEKMHQMTRRMAEEYSEHIWKQNFSPATFNAHVKFLRSIFRVLKEKSGVPEDPFETVRALPKNTQGRLNFTEKELAKICSEAQGNMRYMIAIGIYSGLRLGDIVKMEWACIGKDRMEVTPSKTRRTGKKIIIPLHQVLQCMLEELRKTSRSRFLFPEERDLYMKNASNITDRFQDFLKSCGVETQEKATGHRRRAIVRKGFHSLRHSFVSLCAANRIPQVAIQDLVGHGSPAMTALYAHADQEQKQKAIEGLPTVAFSEKG